MCSWYCSIPLSRVGILYPLMTENNDASIEVSHCGLSMSFEFINMEPKEFDVVRILVKIMFILP